MKKVYSSSKYKRYNKRKSNRCMQKLYRKNRTPWSVHLNNIASQYSNTIRPKRIKHHILNSSRRKDRRPKLIDVPNDFRLIDNTEVCVKFFKQLRNEEYVFMSNNRKTLNITLKNVIRIDYAAISVFKSIVEELNNQKIKVSGDFPDNDECRRQIMQSGFLDHMIDENGKRFKNSTNASLISFDKGTGSLSQKDNKILSNIVNRITSGQTKGKYTKCSMLKSLILEICGNTIEWSGAKNRQWLLGVINNLDETVTITITDIGKGIISTLLKKYKKFWEGLTKTDPEILMGAFEHKYGSNTGESNRNQGLRLVKRFNDDSCLYGLKVITNKVYLDFEDKTLSKEINTNFGGTFFQWTMDGQCVENIINNVWN